MKKLDITYSKIDDYQIDPDEPVYTTGVICRLLDMPVWVLKKLDNENIVSPKRKGDYDSRLYSLNELSLVNHCWKYMNEKKVKVHGLKIILHMEFSR